MPNDFRWENGTKVFLTDEEQAVIDAKRAAKQSNLSRRQALIAIKDLEALETPRRLAEAVLTTEGKTWLANNRALIAVERAKL